MFTLVRAGAGSGDHTHVTIPGCALNKLEAVQGQLGVLTAQAFISAGRLHPAGGVGPVPADVSRGQDAAGAGRRAPHGALHQRRLQRRVPRGASGDQVRLLLLSAWAEIGAMMPDPISSQVENRLYSVSLVAYSGATWNRRTPSG